ncbi:MAG: hypothetical protein KDC80_08215 [Saprospiraceae bacterium]|nr:hypothetical protein [Saprospiraceae bacterium]
MYKLLTKHGQLAAFGLGLLVIIIFMVSVMSGIEGFDALSKEDQYNSTIFDMGLKLTLVLLVVCAVAAILFAIYQMITNPKAALKGMVALVVLVILFFVLYSMSVAETSGPVAEAAEEFGLTDNQSRMVSAGINSTLLLGGVAVAAFIISEIRNLFK